MVACGDDIGDTFGSSDAPSGGTASDASTGGAAMGGAAMGGAAMGGAATGGAMMPAGETFAFGVSSSQSISAAPFPNNIYLNATGNVEIASLSADPKLGGTARTTILDRYTELANTHTGFGFAAPIMFFPDRPVDDTTLAGRVRIVGLSGDDMGREIPAEAFVNNNITGADADNGEAVHAAVMVRPTPGEYLLPASTYGVVITEGVKFTDSTAASAAASLGAVLSAMPGDMISADETAARDTYAPLRDWLTAQSIDPATVVAATIFTTESILPWSAQVVAAVDAFTLEAPTRRVRYDADNSTYLEPAPVSGADLDTYFGTPAAPFERNPGSWSVFNRSNESDTMGPTFYTGGSFRGRVAQVTQGSFVAPAFNVQISDGAPTPSGLRFANGQTQNDGLKAMIPFTLYLCDDHVAPNMPTNLPVALFLHGGSSTRADGIAFANFNCQQGVATISYDLIFHGDRQSTAYLASDNLLAATGAPDTRNHFSGLTEGDANYVADNISDPGNAVVVVGNLFALNDFLDPGIMEANLITPTVETLTLIRLVKDGDWSQIEPNLSFDSSRIFHQSLSFGSSLATPALALSNDLTGAITSVATSNLLINLLQGANNSDQALAATLPTLQLKSGGLELQANTFHSPAIVLHQWLAQRADPIAFAPYVVRQRPTARDFSIVSVGNSWDETLVPRFQITLINAMGLQVITDNNTWQLDSTIPAAASISATPFAMPLSGNITANGQNYTGVAYFLNEPCHALVINPVCNEEFERAYPPIEDRDMRRRFDSPICAIQNSLLGFMTPLLNGDPLAAVSLPSGTCADVYP